MARPQLFEDGSGPNHLLEQHLPDLCGEMEISSDTSMPHHRRRLDAGIHVTVTMPSCQLT